MKRAIFISVCMMLAACPVLMAQQAQPVVYHPMFRTNLDPAKYENPASAILLFQSRENVIRKMLAERQKILATDRRAKALHDKIMKLNKELAVLMENKRAVRDLTRELQLIDRKISVLPLKKNNQTTTKQGNKK
ncbi:MAG: hypothetical protein IKB16_00925 [Lentisphaeria bacterium]|nr:hypothetical protein [Lentisphaeria bacterium]